MCVFKTWLQLPFYHQGIEAIVLIAATTSQACVPRENPDSYQPAFILYRGKRVCVGGERERREGGEGVEIKTITQVARDFWVGEDRDTVVR
jgi:hypothetical protein